MNLPFLFTSFVFSVITCFTSCSREVKQPSNIEINPAKSDTVSVQMSNKLSIKVNSFTFSATLLYNTTSVAFKAMLPLTIKMNELNGNEKYFDLPKSLPTNSSVPSSIHNGDLMMYGSNTFVLFYKTFSSSYRYTKLGQIDDTTKLSEALGSGDVTVKFELIP
ncbi:cyclophilin-like fold protein [Arcicella lustrica]|uniref:Cyclophilin-like fold protein n=1 Tax=Arcicella lustrica TaxID=2984196 RepID=A0ABU5SKU9_9BACT|nr:cyclophilin-like fold protein [Arcicella sp. DC25W]MEA5427901.1 cyclophilin-like fold protein [Arcicella sp. DC25W]